MHSFYYISGIYVILCIYSVYVIDNFWFTFFAQLFIFFPGGLSPWSWLICWRQNKWLSAVAGQRAARLCCRTSMQGDEGPSAKRGKLFVLFGERTADTQRIGALAGGETRSVWSETVLKILHNFSCQHCCRFAAIFFCSGGRVAGWEEEWGVKPRKLDFELWGENNSDLQENEHGSGPEFDSILRKRRCTKRWTCFAALPKWWRSTCLLCSLSTMKLQEFFTQRSNANTTCLEASKTIAGIWSLRMPCWEFLVSKRHRKRDPLRSFTEMPQSFWSGSATWQPVQLQIFGDLNRFFLKKELSWAERTEICSKGLLRAMDLAISMIAQVVLLNLEARQPYSKSGL